METRKPSAHLIPKAYLLPPYRGIDLALGGASRSYLVNRLKGVTEGYTPRFRSQVLRHCLKRVALDTPSRHRVTVSWKIQIHLNLNCSWPWTLGEISESAIRSERIK